MNVPPGDVSERSFQQADITPVIGPPRPPDNRFYHEDRFRSNAQSLFTDVGVGPLPSPNFYPALWSPSLI
ncbi:hypothetical protein KCP74_16230 [Salmonella enterica subsp. enterica]|nr:hypothetical protein KCP74_16230 [Salmonella enterica subsp. enterica]